jgi:hypothetical protein
MTDNVISLEIWRAKKKTKPKIVATPEQMASLGIDENFDAVRDDPRNARYLVPLCPEAEFFAETFADAVYGSVAEERGGFTSEEESNACWEQCLINGRKNECEPHYAVLFC